MSKFYDADVAERGQPGSSHSMMIEMAGVDRRVLDVGCATGYVARGLVRQGCTVVGVDNDPEALRTAGDVFERTLLADLETVDLVGELGPGVFDVVLFGDVLEHLRTPARLLRQARQLLAPGGMVVVSIPNVAHGDLRLALATGRWEYRSLGLLDDTHLRFFTYDGLGELLAQSGLVLTETRVIRVPLFGTELEVHEAQVPAALTAEVRADPTHDAYQFVVRAVPDDADGSVATLAAHDRAQQRRADALTQRVAELEAALAGEQQTTANARAELAEVRADLTRRALDSQARFELLDGSRGVRAIRAARSALHVRPRP